MSITKLVNGVTVELTAEEIAQREAEEQAFLNAPIPVPQSITPLQIRLVLSANGLRDQAEAIVADPETPQSIKDSWEYATTVERNNADLIAMATALGLNDSQIDDMFIQAAGLT